MNRYTLLQRISDGLLPSFITIILYKPIIKIKDTDINGWSFIHFISGIIYNIFDKNIYNAFIVHTIWELFQFIAGDNKIDLESFLDITFDTLFFISGFFVNIY
jgi:hypothetical protein